MTTLTRAKFDAIAEQLEETRIVPVEGVPIWGDITLRKPDEERRATRAGQLSKLKNSEQEFYSTWRIYQIIDWLYDPEQGQYVFRDADVPKLRTLASTDLDPLVQAIDQIAAGDSEGNDLGESSDTSDESEVVAGSPLSLNYA